MGDVNASLALFKKKGQHMAIIHPLTGVELNDVEIERKALNFNEAVTAHLMRMQGEKYNIIAQHLGTNTHRLGEVFREELHIGAKQAASRLLATAAE
ncbi:MAG: hypothetical protein N4A65_00465 [Cohaesibacter sp.]|nr:hypothetical protein [Cohaesibacter sp.]